MPQPENADPQTQLHIILADLDREEHQGWVLQMTEIYSRDPMGADKPLDPSVRENLIPGLRRHPTTMVFLALKDGQPLGIACCFLGFSTFAAKPLINIHDFCVHPAARGLGVARLMLESVEQKGRELGCCKLTLEVLENNHRAKGVYQAAGFAQAVYTEEAGGALFYAKHL